MIESNILETKCWHLFDLRMTVAIIAKYRIKSIKVSLQDFIPYNSYKSVSYTHLDVYKRQVSNMADILQEVKILIQTRQIRILLAFN